MYEAVEVCVNIFQAFAITYYLIKCLGVKEGKNRKCAYITGVIVTVLYLEIMNRIIFLLAVLTFASCSRIVTKDYELLDSGTVAEIDNVEG